MKYPAMLRLAAAAVFIFSATVAITGLAATVAGEAESNVQFTPANEQGHNRYMIAFAEPGLLHRQAGRASGQGFDINAPGMREAQQAVQAEQAGHRQAMESLAGRALEITHHYLVSHSGMAVWLSPDEAAAIAGLSGVVSVERERVYELDTYRGPEFIGAGAIWDGSAVPDGSELLGEDLAIAVLDTGVAPTHPSFANVAACGHGEAGNPNKLISFLDCASTDGGGLCNGPNPADTNGHGSHTASTAGGNVLDNSASPAPDLPPPFDELSGVAPCAYIRSYKVCPSNCPFANVQAGMDSVLMQQSDGVIPIVSMNFSISGGNNPWADNDRKKLDLVDAGIFVAASAGNTRPELPDPVGNVGHLGPWVMSVANISHDVLNANPLSLEGGPQDAAGLQGTGPNLGSDYTGQLAWAGDVASGNELGCSAFPANAFSGNAALIQRGDCNFSVKVDNAVAAGANFVVVFNQLGGPPIVMGGLEPTAVPSVMVTNAVGQAMITALNGGTAELTVSAAREGIQDPDFGDVLSAGSLIGPTPGAFRHLTKPDIAAPGTDIYAAVPGGYDFISGTSMSSPHVAGAATLMRQAQPDWTVSEIKSALQMTAHKTGKKANGDDPWDADDVGHGRTDLSGAALAGLVMDETTANYLAANPTTGGDVRTLNLPAVRNVECTPDCSWTRTLRNTLDVATTWDLSTNNISAGNYTIDVSPATLNFSGDINQTEEITITVTPVGNLTDAVYFGEVVMSEAGDLSPELHITVAFMGSDAVAVPEIGVDPASLSATLPQNQSETQSLTISNSGDATLNWGFAQGGVEPWSDDFDSYANGSQIHGQGGWFGWFNDPAFGAFVSDDEARSAPHSLKIEGGNDPVRPFEGVDSGSVVVTAWQFIPSGYSGESHFIMQNTYNHAGTGLNWSTQINFDSATGLVTNTGASGGAMPYVTDEWVEIRVEINFDSDTQDFYYNDQLLYSGTWTEEVSGGGASNLGAINLFANGATPVYYDDLSVEPGVPEGCDALVDIPWLDAAPTSGSTPPAGQTNVDVTFDPAGIAEGTYDATLCVVSNDPDNELVEVPVTLEVTEAVDLPVADITPESFDFLVPAGGSAGDILNVGNTGEADLEWEVITESALAGRVLRPATSVTLPWTSDAQVHAGGLTRDELANAGEVGVHPFANPRGDLITITHSESMNIASANAVACANEGPPQTTVDNQFLRTFTLSDFDIDGDFDVTEVTFGIENLTANVTVNVNLYTLEGSFVYANLTPIGSASANLAPQELSLVDVPVTGTVPAGSTLVVEIEVPTLLGQGVFFPGSNSLGETAPSYIASAGCGINNPVTYASIGFAQVQLVMAVTGTQGEVLDCELPDWLSVSPDSGTTSPGDSVPVDVMVDAAGLAEGEYEAQLCVATNDPSSSLVTVPVSLTVSADLGVLEVAPAALAFGQVEVGDAATGVITVTNNALVGGGTLTLDAPALSGDAAFALTGGDCAAGTELEPQQSCTVEVGFAPDAEATFTGEVTIGASGQSATVPLSGTGVDELVDEVFSDRFEDGEE